MSLAKVPVTILVSYAFKRCISPPNPPARKEERIKTNFLEQDWYIRIFGPAGDLQFLFGILEAVTILAWNYRSSPLSQTILSALVFSGGRPDQLHLSSMSAIGGVIILAGTLLRLTTYRYLGKFFKYEASIQKDHQLITAGPYGFVRHPSYAALIVSHCGWILWHSGEGSWFRDSGLWNTIGGKFIILGYFVGVMCGELYLVLMRMKNEDEALRKQFGRQWDEWAKGVPYLVVPGVY